MDVNGTETPRRQRPGRPGYGHGQPILPENPDVNQVNIDLGSKRRSPTVRPTRSSSTRPAGDDVITISGEQWQNITVHMVDEAGVARDVTISNSEAC